MPIAATRSSVDVRAKPFFQNTGMARRRATSLSNSLGRAIARMMAVLDRIVKNTAIATKALCAGALGTANVGRAMPRNQDATGLTAQVEVVRGDLTVPETVDSDALRSRRSPNFPHSDVEPTPQECSQRRAVVVSHARGHFLDARVGGSQEVYRPFHPQALKVRQRRLAEHALHVARERSLARPRGLGRIVERKPTFQPGARPSFEALDDRVGMEQMVREGVRRLRGPGVDDQVSGRE